MQNARENLFKKLPDELVPFIEYSRHANLRHKITNGIPLRPHEEILAAIEKQDIGEFRRLYSSSQVYSPIIINTVKDANTVMMFVSEIDGIKLDDFATEKLFIAKLGIRIMPYAVCELPLEEQLQAVRELPKNVVCRLNTQPQSPLAHLRPTIMSRFARL